MMSIGEKVMSGFVALLCVAGAALIVFAVYSTVQHNRFLKEHGCQLIVETPTGRTCLVGKLPEPEYVRVYECIDGDRTEIGT
jgi:hypothetical protein